MDQKLLNALSNLSEALEQISEALKEGKGNKSATTEALQSGNFISEIKQINVGIKQLQLDSKKILKNQETIIQLSKKASGDKKSDFETAGGDKKQESNIKKGVGTILLIAVAVLAIGMAFKLVGGINFLSVIGLSIGILLVAKAFEKVAALRMSLKEAAVVSASLILMAFGITVSSWIMSKITPVSITQSLTAILIGVGFSAMAPAINKIIRAFGGMGWGGIIKAAVGLVMVLPAIALGITLSSFILRKITPISFGQAITAILIAGMFTVLSVSIKRLLGAFGTGIGSLVKAVIFLPLILPAIALGIAKSSWELRKITPITFSQAVTAILIGAMFTVIAFGLNKLLGAFGGNSIIGMAAAILFLPSVMEAVADGIVRASSYLKKTEKIGWDQALSAIMIAAIFTVIAFGLKKMVNAMDAIDNPLGILLIPLLLPAVAWAIQLSSKYLSKVTIVGKDQFWTALGISGLFVVFAIALKIIGPSIDKIGVGSIIKIPLMFTALSGAIWLSSKILAKATVMEDAFLKKLLKFSVVAAIAIGLFAGLTYLVNKIADKSGGFMQLGKGLVAVGIIALAVMVSSKILALGNYKTGAYPSVLWSLGVGLSIAAFALGASVLGPMVFGPQALLFAAGLGAVLAVATTVVIASHILAKGNYKKGPGLLWAVTTTMIMGTFGKLTAILGIMPKSWVKDGTNAVKAVAQSIVDAAWIFNGAKAAFVGGPTKEWAEGVGIAIGAFAPVYKMMTKGGIAQLFMGSGPSPWAFAAAIKTISQGIVDAAWFFQGGAVAFEGGPKKEWAEGVGKAIGAFAPVYKLLADESGFFGTGVGIEDFKNAISTISHGIVAAAVIFADSKVGFGDGTYPSVKWGKGVGAALGAFAPVFKSLSGSWFESGDTVVKNMVNGVVSLAGAIVKVAKKFSDPNVSWTSYPDSKWSFNVKQVVLSYSKLSKKIFDMGVDWMMLNDLQKVVSNVVTTARIFGMNEKYFNAKINPNFMKSISSNLHYYMEIAKKLQSKQGGLTGFLKNAIMGDPIIHMAKGMVELAKAYDKLASSLTKMGKAMENLNDKKISQMERMSKITTPKKDSGGVVGGVLDSLGKVGSFIKSTSNLVSGTNVVTSGASSKRATVDKSLGWPKGKNGDMGKQNDMIIELLQQLNANIGPNSTLNMYLLKNMENKDSSMY